SSLRSSKTARVQPPHPLRATQVCVPPLPRRPAVRRDDPQLPYSCPDQRHPTIMDEPAPENDGGGAPSALVSTPPAGETGVVRRVFGEGEVDLPARPLARVQPRYPEHARLMARESDVKLAVTVEADGAV